MADQSNELELPFSGGSGDLEEAHHELFMVAPEVTVVHLAFTLIGAFVIIFGVGSAFIKEKLYAGEAIIAMCVGMAFGPYGCGLFNPRSWGGGHDYDEVVLEITRIVIALSVFAVGVELPRAYMLKHWKSLSILLGPVMLLGWLISGALMYGLIPAINFLEALVMAAAVTPTDPILAASVVGKGKFASDHVPSHVRHLLQSESGSNDGAAFPFLYLAMFILMRYNDSVGIAIGAWIYLVVLYQIVLGVAVGAIIGVIARKVMKFAKRRALIDRESMVAMYVALALFSTSVTTLFGSDDLLAAFACGSAFAWDDWFTESIEESNFSAIIDLLVNSAIFFFVGATMPFDSWSDSTLTLTPWRLIVLGICILLVRRMPAVYVLQRFIPDIHTSREAIFCGWFGPMGIGAIFISTLAALRLPTPSIPPETSLDILALSVQPVTYFIVMISVIAHGLSIPFFTGARRVHSISRTWTQGSNADGPSWLTRVRRVGDPRDIVINRDDDEKAELGEAGLDLGTDVDVRDFATKYSSSDEKMPYTDSPTEEADMEAKQEDKYADKEENEDEEIYQEGDKTVIDRHGGEDVEEIDKTGHHKHFISHEPRIAEEAEDALEHDEGPLGKMRRGASRGFSTTAIGQSLANRVRNFSIGAPYDPQKEEQYKRERHDCRVTPDKPEREETHRWREGHKIVIERKDGEEVEVIDEDPDTAAQEAAHSHPHREVIRLPAFLAHQRTMDGPLHRSLTDAIRDHLKSAEAEFSRHPDKSKRASHPGQARPTSPPKPHDDEGFLGRMRRGLSTTAGHRAPPPAGLRPASPPRAPTADDEGFLGRMRRGLSTTAGTAAAAGGNDDDRELGRMTRGFSTQSVIGSRLADRVKNFSIGSPYDPAREEEYKRERHDGRPMRSQPGQAMPEEPKRWRQGRQVVIEHRGGEEVEVIDEDPDEDEKQKARDNPNRQVLKLPAFLTRRNTSDRGPTPSQVSEAIRQHLRAEASSSTTTAAAPEPERERELRKEETSSSGSSKGKEKAADQDDASPDDFEQPQPVPEMSEVQKKSSGFLPTLHETGHSGFQDVTRVLSEDRGRGQSRSSAPSASNSRNPSPSRGSIRFDIPETDTQRSGDYRSAASANQRHKGSSSKGRKDLKLKRH